MSTKRPIVALALCFAVAQAPAAIPEYLKVFLSTYKIKADSKIGKAKCMVCHVEGGPPRRNPFGRDVAKAIDAKGATNLTAEILKSLESKDSAKDGLTNGAKIKKDLLPGFPKPPAKESKP